MKIKNLLLISFSLIIPACSKPLLSPDIQKNLDKNNFYITNFYSIHSRLPTREEYWAWSGSNALTQVGEYQISSDDTNNYTLYIWLGEKGVTYSSKTKSIIEK